MNDELGGEMPCDPKTGRITWRIHLVSSPESVYELLNTDWGRASFWAESAREHNGAITFQFPNGTTCTGTILRQSSPSYFVIDYFGSQVEFHLASDGSDGTVLSLVDHGSTEVDRQETYAGWVSVLMALKATADFGIDLRNHDPSRSWDEVFADN
jgi:hypothetical protein